MVATQGCPLCDSPWQAASGEAMVCLFCGNPEEAEFRCGNGHYVCEDCRTADPREIVVRICDRTRETDPVALWHLVTAHGAFRGHGPQFHFVLAPVLLAVLRNRGLAEIAAERVHRTIERLSEIPALSCALHGVCGAGASAGAVVSLLNGATPVSDGERRAVLRATGRAMAAIARHPGGRCCRQSALATLEATWAFLREEMVGRPGEVSGVGGAATSRLLAASHGGGFALEPLVVRCRHFSRVPDCKQGCVYHG